MAGRDERATWKAVPLKKFIDGNGPPPPSILLRNDNVPLLYPQKIHSIWGEPESGKGWLAHLAAQELIETRRHVLYVDFEDDPHTAVERQLAMGTNPKLLLKYLHYVQPFESVAEGWDDLADILTEYDCELAILDGLTEAFGLEGLDTNSNEDVAKWFRRLPRNLVKFGMAVLQIDHVTKAKEGRGRYALGAQHKLAGIHVALSLDVIEPFGRGQTGRVKVKVEKDRPGWLRREAEQGHMGDLVLKENDGIASVELRAPVAPPATVRPEKLMKKISEYVEGNPGLSQKAVRAAVKGKTELVGLALELLEAEGYVEIRAEGNAHKHYAVEPYGAQESVSRKAGKR